MGPVPREGGEEEERLPTPWEAPSTVGRSAGTERELLRLRGEHNWLVVGIRERPARPSLRCVSVSTGGGWVLV